MIQNPFTERGRITDPARFAGRWGELSQIFERLEQGRPVLVTGGAAIGKSSLLTHIMQSASASLDIPNLFSFYLDLADAPGLAEVYRVVVEALGQRGATAAALQVALAGADAPALLCLDNAQVALAQGWGEELLEALARMARGGTLMLVVATAGEPPPLSERYAAVGLGALRPAEVRLVAETYLDETGVAFSPQELRDLHALSAAHPAYLQRAAYHLFESKLRPGLDWRAAYLGEARERPIPGAPLPPEVFSAAQSARVSDSVYGDEPQDDEGGGPRLLPIPETRSLGLLAPLVVGLLLLVVGGSWPAALLGGLVALGAVLILSRRGGGPGRA
jgi:hypothetical protein